METYCYSGITPLRVRSGDVTHLGETVLNLTGSSLADCLEKLRIDGKRFYQLSRPSMVQAFFLIDATRLPLLFEFDRDVKVILVPITKEMMDTGIGSLGEHRIGMLVKPGMGRPRDWEGIDSVFLLSARGWLLIYYFGQGLRLADVGYQQPQMIYLGDEISAMDVSPDLKRIYIGTASGTVYRLFWLSDVALFKPSERRYFLDSSLKVDTFPITSLAELAGGELLLVTSQVGRIQMVKLVDVWEPLWRSGEDQFGLETRVANLRVVSRAINEIILLSPERDIYWFKRPLQDLHTIQVKVGAVEFNEDGSWNITVPRANLTVEVVSRGAPVARAAVVDGRAILYLPAGNYDIVFSQEGIRSRPLPISVSRKGELSVVLIPRPSVIVAERADNLTVLRQTIEQSKPRVSFEVRMNDIDGNPVLEPLRAILYGPELRYISISKDGVFRFPDVPIGLYTLTVEEPGPKYEPFITSLKVTMQGPDPSNIVLQPRRVEVSIRLTDALFRTPALESFRLQLERLEIGSSQLHYPREVTVTRGIITLQLPLGTYRLTAVPVGPSYLPTTSPITFRVEEPTRVEVRVLPREYPITIRVKNSWGEPVTDARVTLVRLEGGYVTEVVARGTSVAEALAPHGMYELTVSANFYRSTSVEVNVPDQQEVEVILEPTMPLLALRYAPYGLLLAITLAGAYVLNLLRKVVEERMRQEYF
ncbi:MAG: carboxypeptidase-like regulatory domain-containing protein [Acidilobaceae archaeon]|nr:carboxypeptidase-like regulatory domain-containing protein [Acidilobaceae archaeon]MDW7973798.1 carboxypeptidase-like regulatory domain-containing protein [Sulfolobales archaeon]